MVETLTPNSYKQCEESIRQLRVKSGIIQSSEWRAKSGISSELRVESSKWEFEKFSSLSWSVKDRHFFDRVRSESSKRESEARVRWDETTLWIVLARSEPIIERRNFANPDRYVNKSRDKQTFKINQESIIVFLTPSLDLSVTS